MGQHRMMPPSDTGSNPITTKVNGRSYACAIGATLDVPDFDGDILEANGWVKSAQNGVGVTAARPANPKKNDRFTDATLGKNIVFDGKVWRDPNTGLPA